MLNSLEECSTISLRVQGVDRMKIEKIENIKKRFKNEWLLIRVQEVKNSKPATGSLLDHNPDRAVIYKEISRYTSQYPVFVSYSQEDLPKGYAAAFSLHV